jgi:hypothetical protein
MPGTKKPTYSCHSCGNHGGSGGVCCGQPMQQNGG